MKFYVVIIDINGYVEEIICNNSEEVEKVIRSENTSDIITIVKGEKWKYNFEFKLTEDTNEAGNSEDNDKNS
jgi:hypothetical protein